MFSTDPLESAGEAGLRYIDGSGPCIKRIACGKSFRYVGPDGKPLRNSAHLGRVRSLVIPPAWKNVWICPSPNGHLQAVGWDARGRKQYRYHPRYREVRDQTKFSRMIAFGTVLAINPPAGAAGPEATRFAQTKSARDCSALAGDELY